MKLILLGILLSSLSLLKCDDYVPVVTINIPAMMQKQTAGHQLDSKEFLDQIKPELSKPNQITLILIKSNTHLNSDDFISQIRKCPTTEKVNYNEMVKEPYTTIMTYLNSAKVNVNKIEVSNVEDGLKKLINLVTPAILMQDGELTLNRQKRAAGDQANAAASANENANRTSIFGDQCAAFFDAISYSDQSQTQTSKVDPLPIDPTGTKFVCTGDANTTKVLTVSFSKNTGIIGKSIKQLSLEFRVATNNLYYVLSASSISLDGAETYPILYMGSPYSMETPLNFSFACTRTPFLLRNKTSDDKSQIKVMFYIQNLQLQALGITPNNTNYTFGQINYCQGFFSSGIWMAITSSLLLALILACGVTALLNVKTMDRFDDPKGKPLNIGVEK